jgi:hypothetical protein
MLSSLLPLITQRLQSERAERAGAHGAIVRAFALEADRPYTAVPAQGAIMPYLPAGRALFDRMQVPLFELRMTRRPEARIVTVPETVDLARRTGNRQARRVCCPEFHDLRV